MDKMKPFAKRSLPSEVKLSVKVSQAKKAEDILILDLREVSTFTDFFVIMTGNSSRQNVAIYEGIEQELKKERFVPLGVEGEKHAEWILMDYGSFVVHVFSKSAREYYLLETLWGDAPKLTYASGYKTFKLYIDISLINHYLLWAIFERAGPDGGPAREKMGLDSECSSK
mgnify:CR=1 FL=1